MKANFFPFGHLPQNQANQIYHWIGCINLISPCAKSEADEDLGSLVEKGRMRLFHPDPVLEQKINQHWQALKDWRTAHSGMDARDLYTTAAKTPFFEPNHTHRLRDDIRRSSQRTPVSSQTASDATDDLFQAWVMLKAAHELDHQNALIEQNLARTENRHRRVVQSLRDVSQDSPAVKGRSLGESIDKDAGIWKPRLRLQSWARVYEAQPVSETDETASIFVTTSPIIVDQLQTVFDTHKAWQGRIGLSLDTDLPRTVDWTAQLQQKLAQLAVDPEPLHLGERLVQWAASDVPKPYKAQLDLWLVPGMAPSAFWQSILCDSNSRQNLGAIHTLIGLFSWK